MMNVVSHFESTVKLNYSFTRGCTGVQLVCLSMLDAHAGCNGALEPAGVLDRHGGYRKQAAYCSQLTHFKHLFFPVPLII